jgi:hypothetical protein
MIVVSRGWMVRTARVVDVGGLVVEAAALKFRKGIRRKRWQRGKGTRQCQGRFQLYSLLDVSLVRMRVMDELEKETVVDEVEARDSGLSVLGICSYKGKKLSTSRCQHLSSHWEAWVGPVQYKLTERGLRERMRRSPSQDTADREPVLTVLGETTGNMGWREMDKCSMPCRGETNSRGSKNSVVHFPSIPLPCQTNLACARIPKLLLAAQGLRTPR